MTTCPYCRASTDDLALHYGRCLAVRAALDPTYTVATHNHADARHHNGGKTDTPSPWRGNGGCRRGKVGQEQH